jgi:hypothetical protein
MREFPQTYRAPWHIVPILLGVVALGAARLLFKAQNENLGGTGEAYIVAGAVLFAALLVAAILRSYTTIDHDGVVVHSLVRSTRFRWQDIGDLRIERADRSGMSKATFPNLVLYDRKPRRVVLPNVSDKRVGGADALERELAELQHAWQAGRGVGWQPQEQEIARLDRRITNTVPIVAIYLLALGIGMVFMVITLIVSLAVLEAPQHSDTTFGQVFGAPFIFGVPAVLAVATFVLGMVWRAHKRDS